MTTTTPALPPRCFNLNTDFLAKYRGRQVTFGFGLVGEMTYRRTYSRRLVADPSRYEEWFDTVQRVVEGAFSILIWHLGKRGLEYSPAKLERSAERMFDHFFTMRCLPPGRGLWAMGTDIVHKKGLGGALQNCAFVSTEFVDNDAHGASPADPFTFCMNASMLGVGTGFDTKGAGKVFVLAPTGPAIEHIVEDSREGWVRSLQILLESWLHTNDREAAHRPVSFDYSRVRLKGELLGTFGGLASGPQPLINLHEFVAKILGPLDGRWLSSRAIVDIMNGIGVAVVAGNVRRTALISFGADDDSDFLDLKNYAVNPERAAWGWASNNSVFASPDTDYTGIAERIRINGEPGLCWLENMRKFGRLADQADFRDYRVAGGNPCVVGETWTLTALGPRQVVDLVGKPVTLIVDGVARETSGFFATGTKPVFRLDVGTGCSVTATADHKILMHDGAWKELGHLVVGDMVVLQQHNNYASPASLGLHENVRPIDEFAYATGAVLSGTLLTPDKKFSSIVLPSDCVSLAYLGITPENCTATKKLEEMPMSFHAIVLRGIFAQHGTRDSSYLYMDVVDKNTQEYVCRTLVRFGITSFSPMHWPHIGVVVRGEKNMRRFCDIIGLTDFNPVGMDDSGWAIVSAITAAGEQPVYDVTVPEVHRFDANGITVHNCLEQSLESEELCNLGETFLNKHVDYGLSREDFLKTLESVFLYV
jgi:hypothetical protein